jgi:hypothetical protein
VVNDDKVINGLWIGTYLSAIEQLTIKSFLNQGHTFVLWTYEPVINVPANTTIKDANEIIPKKDVFTYKYYNQFGHGKGSYAGFSDLFRYKLLYELGGWWVDMDVTCLKPFVFESQYVFRHHHKNGLVGNIMKCPPKSDLMLYCFEQASKLINEDNRDWMLPLKILKEGINKHDLNSYTKDISNKDSWPDVAKLLKSPKSLDQNWYAIHWMNEEWRRLNLSKDTFLKGSLIAKLLFENDIKIKLFPKVKAAHYIYKIGKINYSLINLPFQIKSVFYRIKFGRHQ